MSRKKRLRERLNVQADVGETETQDIRPDYERSRVEDEPKEARTEAEEARDAHRRGLNSGLTK